MGIFYRSSPFGRTLPLSPTVSPCSAVANKSSFRRPRRHTLCNTIQTAGPWGILSVGWARSLEWRFHSRRLAVQRYCLPVHDYSCKLLICQHLCLIGSTLWNLCFLRGISTCSKTLYDGRISWYRLSSKCRLIGCPWWSDRVDSPVKDWGKGWPRLAMVWGLSRVRCRSQRPQSSLAGTYYSFSWLKVHSYLHRQAFSGWRRICVTTLSPYWCLLAPSDYRMQKVTTWSQHHLAQRPHSTQTSNSFCWSNS